MMKKVMMLLLLGIGLFLPACSSPKTFCDTVVDVPAAECSALSDFYQATDGPHWKDHRRWLESPNVCGWFGVSCTDGHVTMIGMNYADIGGQLPASLSGLDHLEVLSLYYNEISGPIPPKLGDLENLQVLILHNNHLSGSLPPELGKLANLRLLDLDGNDLSGPIPPEYGHLTSLEALKLRDNELSGELPAELGYLDRLQGLWLSTNNFSGEIPTEWSGMTSLRMFAAFGNENLGPLPPFLASLPPDGYPDWANPNIP